MPSLPRSAYDELSGELASELVLTIEGFAKRHGYDYDRPGFLAQSSCAEDSMKELMGFGLDLWPEETDDDDGERVKVIPFPARSTSSCSMAALAAMAMMALLGAGLFLSEPVNMTPHDMIQIAAVEIEAG